MDDRPLLLPAHRAAVLLGVHISQFQKWANTEGCMPDSSACDEAGGLLWSRLQLEDWTRQGCPPTVNRRGFPDNDLSADPLDDPNYPN